MGLDGVVAQRWTVPFSAGSRDQVSLLGGKGAGLAELARLGLHVPPGFVVTTAACRAFLDGGVMPDDLMTEVRAAIEELAEQAGRRFGDPQLPLLVSVRSGAPASMPGMMDTILNVGLSQKTLPGFADAVGHDIAQACLIRLHEMYTAAVGDANVPEDPWEQLERSIETVFASWNSKRARLYRRYNHITETGTAVVIQTMVFGNAGPQSGTGVIFTRDPSTGDHRPFGDYLAGAQGEDVVAGTRNTDDLTEMHRAVPAAHAELLIAADVIERHFGDMCEIEFTVEQGQLWLLQCRVGQRTPQASLRIAVRLALKGTIAPAEAISRVRIDEIEGLLHPRLNREAVDERSVLATGIGASPGLAHGRVAFDSVRARQLAAGGGSVILVRNETRPDDLEGILASSGLLTTHGGKTSHAAVVTRGLGRPCVCGAEALTIDPNSGTLHVHGVVVREGDTISIDGDSGMVLLGTAPPVNPSPPEEFGDLLAWCDSVRDLRVAALSTTVGHVLAATEAGADEIVLDLGSRSFKPGLIRAGVAAACGLPVTVLTQLPRDGDGSRIERIVHAVACEAPAVTTVVVPHESWELAAHFTRRLSLSVDLGAWLDLDEGIRGETPVAAVRWTVPPPDVVKPVAGSVEGGVLSVPPNLDAANLATARAIGARAVAVPTNRVAVARLALAQTRTR